MKNEESGCAFTPHGHSSFFILHSSSLFLSLGTNLGNKEQNLRVAIHKIGERIGTVVSQSAFYATAPWGFSSDNSFLNAALCVETPLTPFQALAITQEIEREMGRTHKSVDGVYTDRVIDIDLLLYDRLILDTPALKLPHPLMQERDFVMRPLAEIAPELLHPVFGKPLRELAGMTAQDSPQPVNL